MLRLYKGYFIPSLLGITKKLIQQYVRSFQILERVCRLAYKLDVPHKRRIYLIFFIKYLESAPLLDEDLFGCSKPKNPSHVIVKGDTNVVKSFKIDRLLNKQIVIKSRGHGVKNLINNVGIAQKNR